MISKTVITADGDYVLIENSHFGRALANIRGTFGGGTITFGYRDDDQAYQRYQENAQYLSDDNVYIPGMGLYTTLMVRMEGSTNPNVTIELNKEIEGR